MPAHIVLIDAMNLIRRIYAVQERPFHYMDTLSESTKQQIIHNTKIHTIQAVRKILDSQQPTHILAVFDSKQPCWRYQVYPDYKKGRKKMPEHLEQSLVSIQDALLDLQVDSLVSDDDEADDLIATLAVKVALRAQDVTIISTDKGFLPLLCDHIRVFDYFNQRHLDEAYVRDKFQVKSTQLIDLWTLSGDSTNKIPGVPGIGQITASKLLQQYHSLKGVLNASDLKNSLMKTLDEHKLQMQLYQELLTLKKDIPLGFNLKDIRIPKPVSQQAV
ncbi:flap endonuclease Xni [Thalassotalea mangrovi]|uniref:Flap endonuclease Xni n=1 Tax=Thalassotalea mangrovi TaxID=2572245 RepID=A0A4U1B294_9GAMM|nr:flap endonuclease Xni [Thalassotalea mangrovi]TKB43521.1 flap endonuclease Xni [Thalassotalea mangrovi]